jgi:ATP-dependent helicase/nuclease subunit B
MSYRFCFGASGAGKSHELIQEVIRRAKSALDHYVYGENPAEGQDAGEPGELTNFLYIVPEQYTMQTQKDLVLASPSHGIMNIDVLSFGRLSHRVFEETGAGPQVVLDDVGKSLILKKAAISCRKELTTIGGRIERLGMISEVKSMISEFMQYGISAQGVRDLASYAKDHGQGALSGKLTDLAILYDAFLTYEQNRFLTSEESLDLLAEAIPNSQLIRSSVLVFDGFTGFTPVQYRVLEALMQNAREVIFSVTIGEDGGPAPSECEILPSKEHRKNNRRPFLDPQDLFYLSRKTIRDVAMAADRVGCPHGEDRYIGAAERPTSRDADVSGAPGRERMLEAATPRRFEKRGALAHLERHLFRYPVESYTGEDQAVELFIASSPREEVRQLCIRIREMIRAEGLAFRDFGIVAGDLAAYADIIAEEAAVYDIPVYIDETRAVLQNPLTEAIRSALEILESGYSYEAVFRYLRSGLTQLPSDEVDRLENYCLARGIHSKKKWNTPFDDTGAEASRMAFLAELAPLTEGMHATAGEKTAALYEFLVSIHAKKTIQALSERFAAEGDVVREKEYGQIYPAVIHLLDQIYALIGDETIAVKDYRELIEAGFDEIRLGTLPQRVDRILVGDIERSRLGEVKVLFFLGVNDGAIPRNTSKGGLVSDLDREFLEQAREELRMELSPTPREQMYIQRLYLYLNMTKETEKLIVSFSKTAEDGGSLRPSYLIQTLRNLFPGIQIHIPEERPLAEQIAGPKDGISFLSSSIRAFADGLYDSDIHDDTKASRDKAAKREMFLTVFGYMADARQETRDAARRLAEDAFRRYEAKPISRKSAEQLYGRVLKGSVSRLETAVQCYMKQFLQYGLRLHARPEYRFEPADSGTVLHEGIRRFSEKLGERGMDWKTFTGEDGDALVKEALLEEAAGYNNDILFANERTRYNVERMERVLRRTVDTLQYQLQQGEFTPAAYEVSFGDHNELRFALSDGKELILVGRIDRVDLCEKDGRTWVKIIDYKSGNPDLDEDEVRQGLRLQLVMYMDAEIDKLKGLNPDAEISPAALLYYHFGDPVLSAGKGLPTSLADAEPVTEEAEPEEMERMQQDAQNAIRRQLRPKGMVNEDEEAITLLDGSFAGESMVIPVKRTKKGGFTKASKIFSEDTFRALTGDVRRIICSVADNILAGNIDADPAILTAQRSACTYCDYRNVCGFDPKTPGYAYRIPESLAGDRAGASASASSTSDDSGSNASTTADHHSEATS